MPTKTKHEPLATANTPVTARKDTDTRTKEQREEDLLDALTAFLDLDFNDGSKDEEKSVWAKQANEIHKALRFHARQCVRGK
jgi:hypothetical protein